MGYQKLSLIDDGGRGTEMDLQAAHLEKDKRNSLNKFVVICCLVLTAIFLAGSLISPGRASQNEFSPHHTDRHSP